MRYTPLIHMQDEIANLFWLPHTTPHSNQNATLPVIGSVQQTMAYFNNNSLAERMPHYFTPAGGNVFALG